MFKREKSLFEQLVGRDVGQSPNIMSVPLKLGHLATIYKLGYIKRGSTAFKVQKDGCGVPSAARTLLGPEGLLMR